METLNITPKEVRKTYWHIIGGLAILVLLWKLPELLVVLLK